MKIEYKSDLQYFFPIKFSFFLDDVFPIYSTPETEYIGSHVDKIINIAAFFGHILYTVGHEVRTTIDVLFHKYLQMSAIKQKKTLKWIIAEMHILTLTNKQMPQSLALPMSFSFRGYWRLIFFAV